MKSAIGCGIGLFIAFIGLQNCGIIVGVMMCSNTTGVDWDDYTEAIPAFVTMLMMPLNYSISDGIMFGTIMYVLMKIGAGMKGIRQISPTMWVLFAVFVLRYVLK